MASSAGLKTLYDAENMQLTVLTTNRDAQRQTLDGLLGEYDRLQEDIRIVREQAKALAHQKLAYALLVTFII